MSSKKIFLQKYLFTRVIIDDTQANYQAMNDTPDWCGTKMIGVNALALQSSQTVTQLSAAYSKNNNPQSEVGVCSTTPGSCKSP